MDPDTSRLSRLTAILLQLQARRLVTAPALAERFGVSVRTVYRDIRALEAAGVPVRTEDGKGYSLMDGYRVAPVAFTDREANALITAEQLVLKNNDASFAQDYTDAVNKVRAVLRQSTKEGADLLSRRIVVGWKPSGDAATHLLPDLQRALTGFYLVDIAYQKDGETAPTQRTVEPFALLSSETSWLLAAWCRLRAAFRLFRLDRIRTLRVRTDRFEPHKLTLDEYLHFLRQRDHP